LERTEGSLAGLQATLNQALQALRLKKNRLPVSEGSY
jgi:hypothetical protein